MLFLVLESTLQGVLDSIRSQHIWTAGKAQQGAVGVQGRVVSRAVMSGTQFPLRQKIGTGASSAAIHPLLLAVFICLC